VKRLPALILTGALSLCVTACGGTDKADPTGTTPVSSNTATVKLNTVPTKAPPAPAKTTADADNDTDLGAPNDDTNNNGVVDFGHEADAADTQAITDLVKRYFAAALAGNGAAACSMLYSTLSESVPEDYGESPPGQPYMRGTTCPAVLKLLFKHEHPQLAAEVPKLQVARVRLSEHHGLVVLRFAKLPERQISVGREGHTWRIQGLLDSPMP